MEWISVKDRLPEEEEFYLIANKNGDIEIALFDFYKSKKFIQYDEDGYPMGMRGFTHWMPLPKPPEDDR